MRFHTTVCLSVPFYPCMLDLTFVWPTKFRWGFISPLLLLNFLSSVGKIFFCWILSLNWWNCSWSITVIVLIAVAAHCIRTLESQTTWIVIFMICCDLFCLKVLNMFWKPRIGGTWHYNKLMRWNMWWVSYEPLNNSWVEWSVAGNLHSKFKELWAMFWEDRIVRRLVLCIVLGATWSLMENLRLRWSSWWGDEPF